MDKQVKHAAYRTGNTKKQTLAHKKTSHADILIRLTKSLRTRRLQKLLLVVKEFQEPFNRCNLDCSDWPQRMSASEPASVHSYPVTWPRGHAMHGEQNRHTVCLGNLNQTNHIV